MASEYRHEGPPDLVVLGAASRDLQADDSRGWRLGGGVTYSSFTAARLGVRVGAVIGLDTKAAEARELTALEALGVQLHRARLRHGPVFENRETAAGRRQIAHSLSDPISPDELPPAWRDRPAYLINPVAGELDDGWAQVLPRAALVGLDCQGLMRDLIAGEAVRAIALRPGALVRRADLMALSDEDARGGAPELRAILTRDGQELVVKNGVRGALHVVRSGGALAMRLLPIFPSRRTVDRTGAGDAFLAAWMCGHLALGVSIAPRGTVALGGASPASIVRPLVLAALAASLTVEREPTDAASLRKRAAELHAAAPTEE